MRVLTGAVAALALVGSGGAYAQGVYIAEPAPVIVTPAPSAVYVEPGYSQSAGVTVIDPRTGRRCTMEPSGYRWCWTP